MHEFVTEPPSVDVVIPNYNYGHYLQACAESVLSQYGVRVRLLIIDNASSDNSAEISKKIAKDDQRVELVLCTRNLGPHASFNAAIDWAVSDYFLILCADDLLSDGALLRATGILDQQPNVHLAYGVSQKIHTKDCLWQEPMVFDEGRWERRSGREFIDLACKNAFNPVAGPTAVVRTSVQKRVGYYRATLKHTDDLEMWLRFALYGDVVSTRTIQAYARVHENNQSAKVCGIQNWNQEFEAAFMSFFNNEGHHMPGAEHLIQLVLKCLSKRAYWSSLSNLVRGETGSAALMRYALSRHPILAFMPPIDYLIRRVGRYT